MRKAAVPPIKVPMIVNGSGTAVGVGGGAIAPRGAADAAIGKEIAETATAPIKNLMLCKM